MKVFIDFDGVLFDIVRHKREYFRLFERFGISRREARKTYEEMKKEIGRDDQKFYVRRFKERHPHLRSRVLLHAIHDFKGRSASCVYKESRPFLLGLQRIDFELHLVSSGSKKFQKKKCETSGLMRYFQGVHILEHGEKGRVIRRIMNSRGVSIFLDDKGSVADDVKKYIPHAIVIQVLRHTADTRSQKADIVVSNLREALRYIKTRV